jgi:urease accessory protein
MSPAATEIRKFLGILQLASPALPIGGFSYSQGLESAIELGLVHDAASTQVWIQDCLETALGLNELLMLAALYRD